MHTIILTSVKNVIQSLLYKMSYDTQIKGRRHIRRRSQVFVCIESTIAWILHSRNWRGIVSVKFYLPILVQYDRYSLSNTIVYRTQYIDVLIYVIESIHIDKTQKLAIIRLDR
jgi:hypothetical protein